MINANLWVMIEKPSDKDAERISSAIKLLEEIAHQIGGCTSSDEAYMPFLEMANTRREILSGKWMY